MVRATGTGISVGVFTDSLIMLNKLQARIQSALEVLMKSSFRAIIFYNLLS